MHRMTRRLLLFVAIPSLITALVAGGGLDMQDDYVFQGGEILPATVAAPFTLTDQYGNPFSIEAQAGKVVLLYFGYTTCPDACPTTLSDWIEVKRQLGPLADQVVFAMVTVDPERDTPARLAKYLDFFDPTFFGLGGSQEAITAIEANYGVIAIREDYPQSATKYLMNHTTSSFVIDRDGNLRLVFAHGTDPAVIVEDVTHLLD
jgi:protein SCO1/2